MASASIAIIGGGPAGLMAAEVLSAHGHAISIFDAMPSLGRKLLLAGKTGLNITHSEPHERFVTRYGAANDWLKPMLDAFGPRAVETWANGLGAECFSGSSGRVFPKAMKASPLLRAWLKRLEAQGVKLFKRHRWTGVEAGAGGLALSFETPEGESRLAFDAGLLALGGASWPRLGSDGGWVKILEGHGVPVSSLKPANCGFDVSWSEHFASRFAGAPVKGVTAKSDAGTMPGEFVVSQTGIEGSLVYAHSAALRDLLEAQGKAVLRLDLAPGRSAEKLTHDLARQPAKASFSNRLRKGAGLEGVKAALMREVVPDASGLGENELAALIKALPLQVIRTRPLAEAISTAGGIAPEGLDENLMLRAVPGLHAAGEMLDWEAPTGGYLLTACLATGHHAAKGVLHRLKIGS